MVVSHSRGNPDPPAVRTLRDTVTHRVLHQWLKHEGRHQGIPRGRLDVDFHPQTVGEPGALDVEVEVEQLQLAAERHLVADFALQRQAQKLAEAREHLDGLRLVSATHQAGDRVERVEEKMRVELHPKSIETRLVHVRLECRRAHLKCCRGSLPLPHPPAELACVPGDGDGAVGHHVHHQIAVGKGLHLPQRRRQKPAGAGSQVRKGRYRSRVPVQDADDGQVEERQRDRREDVYDQGAWPPRPVEAESCGEVERHRSEERPGPPPRHVPYERRPPASWDALKLVGDVRFARFQQAEQGPRTDHCRRGASCEGHPCLVGACRGDGTGTPGCTFERLLRRALAGGLEVGQEAGEEAQRRQVRADLIDEGDVGVVGQPAEHRGADAGDAEREAEEETRDQSDVARHQLLGVHEDRGEGRGQDQRR